MTTAVAVRMVTETMAAATKGEARKAGVKAAVRAAVEEARPAPGTGEAECAGDRREALVAETVAGGAAAAVPEEGRSHRWQSSGLG